MHIMSQIEHQERTNRVRRQRLISHSGLLYRNIYMNIIVLFMLLAKRALCLKMGYVRNPRVDHFPLWNIGKIEGIIFGQPHLWDTDGHRISELNSREPLRCFCFGNVKSHQHQIIHQIITHWLVLSPWFPPDDSSGIFMDSPRRSRVQRDRPRDPKDGRCWSNGSSSKVDVFEKTVDYDHLIYDDPLVNWWLMVISWDLYNGISWWFSMV